MTYAFFCTAPNCFGQVQNVLNLYKDKSLELLSYQKKQLSKIDVSRVIYSVITELKFSSRVFLRVEK